MWKRDEAVKPTGPGTPAAPVAPTQHQPQANVPTAQAEPRRQQMTEGDVVNIGKSVVIKGELNGSEDLTVEGHVEGKIELRDHVLTIGPNGKIKAQVFAKAVIVLGEGTGNVTATKRVDIRTVARSTVTSSRRAWRSPRALTSAAASTCSAKGRSASPIKSEGQQNQKVAAVPKPAQPVGAH